MSVLPRFDPLPGFNFLITLIDNSSTFSAIASGVSGLLLGGFSECTGLESNLETFEYKEGGVNDRIHRFASRNSYGNIILKRGVGFGEDLWLWHQEFIEGEGKRRDGFIILQNEMQIPIKIWSFSRGLPIKWSGPAFNAQSSAVSIESMEIAHEQLKLEFSPGALLDDLTSAIF